jgi:cell volume regulation protein A
VELINQFVLVGAALLLLAILASAVSYRVGMPLLVAFLMVGMLAGEDGPGGIIFNDAPLAYLGGSVALAIILLDGGLNTRADSFRAGLRPAFTLATVGVLITCLITGLFAAWVLDLTLLEGLLIGAIVGSTDAAAVFALLRAKGLALKQRVSATLEIESGSNDPMAIFLTIALVEVLARGQQAPGWEMLWLFLLQMGLGAAVGLIGGRLLAWLLNRLTLESGMYPMLTLTGSVVLYGVTAVLGGSGFLAIYLVGLVLGNRPIRDGRAIRRVHHGLAWLSQIGMFLMLGLLATPTALIPYAPASLAIAVVLMLVARPAAVVLCLLPFRFPWREQVFIAWVGLRGAVPIILALFPLLAGLPKAQGFLDVAFFVVLVSLLVQGWTLAPLARRLGLEIPPLPAPDEQLNLEATAGRHHALVGYRLTVEGPLTGLAVRDLYLPGGARLVAVFRRGEPLDAATAGFLQTGDLIYVLAEEAALPKVGELFAVGAKDARLADRAFFGDFILHGDASLHEVAAAYGLPLPPEATGQTLAGFVTNAFHGRPVVGDRSCLGGMEFVVREIIDGQITRVGIKLTSFLPPPAGGGRNS